MSAGKRLAAYLDGWQGRAFDWSTANCCGFAAEWVSECEGANPMAGITPSGKFAALRLVADLGGLEDAVSQCLARPQIAPSLAQVGDVVMVGQSIGICTGRTAALMSESGLVRAPMSQAVAAWRVNQ